MRRVYVTLLTAMGSLAALSWAATANPLTGPREQDRSQPYMRVYGVSQPPYGFVEFCQRAKRTVITASREAYDEFVRRLEGPPRPSAHL